MATIDTRSSLFNHGEATQPERERLARACRLGAQALMRSVRTRPPTEGEVIDAEKAEAYSERVQELAKTRDLECAIGETAIHQHLEAMPFASPEETAADPGNAVLLASETLVGHVWLGKSPEEVAALAHVVAEEEVMIDSLLAAHVDSEKDELLISARQALTALHEELSVPSQPSA